MFQWPMRSRENDRLSRTLGESSGDALVFADPHTAGPLDKAAILRRYRRAAPQAAQLEQSHRFHDDADTSARRWLIPAFPCGLSRSGWGIGTSRRTQRYGGTTRQAPASWHSWRQCLGQAALSGLSRGEQRDVVSELFLKDCGAGLFQEVAEHLAE